MKFACIEYTTKTRTIWRHTPKRPNYLCDPEKEIDPTSFGCYTSALHGEHLPLTGLIYGSLNRPPSLLQRARQDLQRRRHGAFASFDLSPLRQFDVLLVIYQTSYDDELVRFVERAHRELPDTIVVTCSSPPFGRLREHWKEHPETAERYRAFLDASHFNMNVCRATVPYYRFLSSTPSLYLPQPYPVEYALEQASPPRNWDESSAEAGGALRGPPAERQQPAERPLPTPVRGHLGTSDVGAGLSPRSSAPVGAERAMPSGGGAVRQDPPQRPPVIYVAGDTVRPDIMTGHLIAKVLQERHPELLIRVTKTPEFTLNTAFLRGARFEVVPFLPWAAQLRELAGYRLVLNTDLWWTRGRVPVDCAAAGVPCVGTTSDGQKELWPDLYAGESLGIDRLLDLAGRALMDEEFRARAIATARNRLPNYAYEDSVERFTHAVELARTGRLSAWSDPVWVNDRLALETP